MKFAASHRARTWGFSLVELLVAMAVIALLVSILLPSLGRARAVTQRVLCQNQLRQWASAFAMYATENEDVYPHTDGLDRDKGPPDRCGWVDVLPPIICITPWRDHPIWQRPGAGTFFQCPSARLAPDGSYAYRPRRDGYFSYAMNSCLELDGDCWRAPGDGGAAMPSFLKTDLIVRPDRVVLLFDQLLDPSRGYGDQGDCLTAGKYCGSYPKVFSARHAQSDEGLGGSILFCDGHVNWQGTVWKDTWPADLEVPPRDDENWFPYPAGS